MRTTITIHDDLHRELKTRAAELGCSVSEFVEEAVRDALRPGVTVDPEELPPLPVVGGSGLMPGVDLRDSGALRDLMDEDSGIDALR